MRCELCGRARWQVRQRGHDYRCPKRRPGYDEAERREAHQKAREKYKAKHDNR